MWVLKILEYCNGSPSMFDGQYLASYDANYVNPSGYDGGLLITSFEVENAMKFAELKKLVEVYRTVAPEPYSKRPDGRPNRPLMAFNIEISRI